VTANASAHSIGYVPGWTSHASGTGLPRLPLIALTKRRAVDFCRVATALCCPPVGELAVGELAVGGDLAGGDLAVGGDLAGPGRGLALRR
jgi:hypothetical protein